MTSTLRAGGRADALMPSCPCMHHSRGDTWGEGKAGARRLTWGEGRVWESRHAPETRQVWPTDPTSQDEEGHAVLR